jgi:hypothetical protein
MKRLSMKFKLSCLIVKKLLVKPKFEKLEFQCTALDNNKKYGHEQVMKKL